MGHPILIGTHHKTGTIWMQRTFTEFAAITRRGFLALGRSMDARPADIYFAHHSEFPPQLLTSEARGLHLIRDPRDIVISGMHHHLRANEGWLHEPAFDGLTYQQKLRSLDAHERFEFELTHAAADTVKELLAWNYSDPRFAELRYENLIRDRDGRRFGAAMRFLGFDTMEAAAGAAIFCRKALFNRPATAAADPHIRSGEPQQWRRYYRRWHAERFIDVLGDCLIQLGYEPDHAWADRQPG